MFTKLSDIGNTICLIFATIGAGISSYLGGWDMSLSVLVAFVIVDYLTGLSVAIFINKNVSSEVGFKGIAKKLLIFGLIGLCCMLDKAINQDILRNLAIFFYIANEGISLLENTTKLGVPYPEQLKEVLIQLKEKTSDKVNNK